MKLQYLIIIFLAIMLPISLILSQYIGTEIDALADKTKYDTALLGATFDAMSAYEMNTRNIENSTVVAEDIIEIEAAISTFSRSLSSSLGLVGISKDYMLSYIPAIAFCMYDGYYIYLPNDDLGNTSKLQPYVYYSRNYTNGDDNNITIAFSLDNYVTIYGTYWDNEDNKVKSISAAGYLIVTDENELSGNGVYISEDKTVVKYKGIEINEETLYENNPTSVYDTKYENVTKPTSDAKKYYKKANNFTRMYNDVIKSLIGTEDYDKLYINKDNDPEDEGSAFVQEKTKVIKEALTTNLNRAIVNFDGTSSSYYELPQLSATDWEKITNDISIVAFMKDIPLENVTTYNKYVVVNSSITPRYTSAKSISFIEYVPSDDSVKSNGYYHQITCPELLSNLDENSTLIGYSSADFERFRATKLANIQEGEDKNEYYYYYKHNEFADYNCEIEPIESVNVATIEKYFEDHTEYNNIKDKVLSAYYTAVGRIRFSQQKASSYINIDEETTE